jgi:hypothetical protein
VTGEKSLSELSLGLKTAEAVRVNGAPLKFTPPPLHSSCTPAAVLAQCLPHMQALCWCDCGCKPGHGQHS